MLAYHLSGHIVKLLIQCPLFIIENFDFQTNCYSMNWEIFERTWEKQTCAIENSTENTANEERKSLREKIMNHININIQLKAISLYV